MKSVISNSKLYGTNAERLAMNLTTTDNEIHFYETDTNSEYEWKGSEWVLKSINGAACVTEQGQIGGERNTASTTNNYDAIRNEANVQVLTGTGAITLGAAAANVTEFMGAVILKSAGPATLTVAGFQNESGVAKSLVFTGSTTLDTVINLGGLALRADLGALTVTASVADVVAVTWRPI